MFRGIKACIFIGEILKNNKMLIIIVQINNCFLEEQKSQYYILHESFFTKFSYFLLLSFIVEILSKNSLMEMF